MTFNPWLCYLKTYELILKRRQPPRNISGKTYLIYKMKDQNLMNLYSW